MLATLVFPTIALAQSDLQGVWTNGTLTPFERPPALGTKAFFTPEEAVVEERQATERRNSRTRRPGDVGSDNEAFVDTGYKFVSTRQTSLVVDPPDGRIPIRPEAEKQRDFNVNNARRVRDDEPVGPVHHAQSDEPVSRRLQQRVPDRPDARLRRDHVGDDPRGARSSRSTDGRTSTGSVGQWLGDSRGRWEGETLVVDTTNFRGSGWIATHAGAGRLRGVPHSRALHIVERLTRVDASTI